jgi:hypothetical protein
MMTPITPGNNIGNQFANAGNLMGFAAGGFMMSGQVNFTPSQLVTETKDKYAGLKTGMGHVNDRTNLAQLPEVKIALDEIMSKNKNLKFDKVAELLKKDYGIDAKVIDVKNDKGKSAKALEITTPDGRKGIMADGNGNNVLDKNDYKFKEAATDVMKQYGLEGMDPKQAVQKIQQMAQPQAGMQMQMMGAGMMGMGGISARANNPMEVFGNMLNQNSHNAYGTYQNNQFLGGLGQQPSAATNNYFAATSMFAMLAAEAHSFM